MMRRKLSLETRLATIQKIGNIAPDFRPGVQEDSIEPFRILNRTASHLRRRINFGYYPLMVYANVVESIPITEPCLVYDQQHQQTVVPLWTPNGDCTLDNGPLMVIALLIIEVAGLAE